MQPMHFHSEMHVLHLDVKLQTGTWKTVKYGNRSTQVYEKTHLSVTNALLTDGCAL